MTDTAPPAPPRNWYDRTASPRFVATSALLAVLTVVLYILIPDLAVAAYLGICLGAWVLAFTVGQMIKTRTVTNGELLQILVGLAATGLGGTSTARKAFDGPPEVAIGVPVLTIVVAVVIGVLGYRSAPSTAT